MLHGPAPKRSRCDSGSAGGNSSVKAAPSSDSESNVSSRESPSSEDSSAPPSPDTFPPSECVLPPSLYAPVRAIQPRQQVFRVAAGVNLCRHAIEECKCKLDCFMTSEYEAYSWLCLTEENTYLNMVEQFCPPSSIDECRRRLPLQISFHWSLLSSLIRPATPSQYQRPIHRGRPDFGYYDYLSFMFHNLLRRFDYIMSMHPNLQVILVPKYSLPFHGTTRRSPACILADLAYKQECHRVPAAQMLNLIQMAREETSRLMMEL